MPVFSFDTDKSIHSLLYITSKVGSVRFHKLFKILYFAELKHIAAYGRPIVGDKYIAMKDGPVPSKIYNYLKDIRGFFSTNNEYFDVNLLSSVTAKVLPNLDELSQSDIECLDQSILENKDLSWKQLRDKSHDDAYNSTSLNREISIDKIVDVSGASEGMINYIRDSSDYINYSPTSSRIVSDSNW